MSDNERQRLLGGQRGSLASQNSDAPSRRFESTAVQVEHPPALMQPTTPFGPKIACRVCGEPIDLTDRMESPVVKCSKCSESTPIKPAPAGKKYIRCVCHCLLVCKQTANRVSCPRENCARILTLAPITDSYHTFPGLCNVTCAYCNRTFSFNTLSNALARCPNCRRVTSVGSEFARSRGLIYLILSLLSAIIGIAITVATFHIATSERAWFAAYVICFVSFVVLLLRSIYYCTLRVSLISNPGDNHINA